MPDEQEPNAIENRGRLRSTDRGDVPEAVRRRYYVDEQGGPGLGFYGDARVTLPTFRDRGAQLDAPRNDPNAVRDMAAIARHRGWTTIAVRGDREFRREAWLAATSIGIEVRGYRPTERDLQELERRELAHARRAARPDERAPGVASSVRQNLAVVETVVRARIQEAGAQDRILAVARERIARWLEQGARLDPLHVARNPEASRATDTSRERQRSR